MRIFSNTPPENNPIIEKHGDDKISIMALGGGALVELSYKNMFVCKEIMLQIKVDGKGELNDEVYC